MKREIKTVLARLDWSDADKARLRKTFPPADIVFAHRDDHARINRTLEVCDVAILDGVLDDRYLAAPHLRWVHCDQSGLDGFAPPELANSDLIVTSSKGRSAPVLAEHAVYFMLSLCYRADRMRRAKRLRSWGITGQEHLRGLNGKRLCILGLGATGTALAEQGKVLGMDVVAYRRRNVPSHLPGVRVYSQDAGDTVVDAMRGADIVALCASLNDESLEFVGSAELAAMERGGYLVNVARAQLVDEAAMIDALKSGQLGGAGLDVSDPHEPLPPWHRLWSAPNVILTPHVTPQMPDRTGRTLDILAENRALFLDGAPLKHVFTAKDVFTRGRSPTVFRGAYRLTKTWQSVVRRFT